MSQTVAEVCPQVLWKTLTNAQWNPWVFAQNVCVMVFPLIYNITDISSALAYKNSTGKGLWGMFITYIKDSYLTWQLAPALFGNPQYSAPLGTNWNLFLSALYLGCLISQSYSKNNGSDGTFVIAVGTSDSDGNWTTSTSQYYRSFTIPSCIDLVDQKDTSEQGTGSPSTASLTTIQKWLSSKVYNRVYFANPGQVSSSNQLTTDHNYNVFAANWGNSSGDGSNTNPTLLFVINGVMPTVALWPNFDILPGLVAVGKGISPDGGELFYATCPTCPAAGAPPVVKGQVSFTKSMIPHLYAGSSGTGGKKGNGNGNGGTDKPPHHPTTPSSSKTGGLPILPIGIGVVGFVFVMFFFLIMVVLVKKKKQ